VHAHVAPQAVAATTDRAQRGGAPLGDGIVGEDVVDLVAPPTRAQAANPLALAVA
jgi:hypothetical protein